MTDFKFDVFLSHSSKDKMVVRAIAERPRKDGLRVWFDNWEFKPGDRIPLRCGSGAPAAITGRTPHYRLDRGDGTAPTAGLSL